ncbi:galactokinase [Verrucomicrobiales bacterium]|nr:galactokinase [Verrucomicrobiales bacterium]
MHNSSITKENCIARFKEIFNRSPEAYAYSPGRINLIGEHVDYQNGIVFPAAINKYIHGVAAAIQEPLIKVWSSFDHERILEIKLDQLEPQRGKDSWINYIIGVIAQYIKKGAKVRGLEIVFESDLPSGSGMSSSAALESTTALLIESLFDFTLNPIERAKACQAAEHEFAGVPCGIMDQIAVNCGTQGHALMIDCKSLELTPFPILDSIAIVVADTKVKHDLADGQYAKRKLECDEACEALGVQSLREASLGELNEVKDILGTTVFRRASHVISEIIRVKEFATAMEQNDTTKMGLLLAESHESLKSDFEVSCPELDRLVQISEKLDAVGSRMMGGGFGGSTINLVKKQNKEQFLEQIKLLHFEMTGNDIDAWSVDPVSGATTSDI